MCFVSAIIAGVTTAVSTSISIAQQTATANYQVKVAEANAKARRQQAKRARTLAAIDAQAELREGQGIASAQRAGIAATGFDVNVGDAASLVAETSGRAAFNARGVLGAGITRGGALDFQARQFESQAASLRSSIVPTIVGGAFGGASSVASIWYSAASSNTRRFAGFA